MWSTVSSSRYRSCETATTPPGETGDQVLELTAAVRVQVRLGLVQQQQVRLRDQARRQRDELALAPGELRSSAAPGPPPGCRATGAGCAPARPVRARRSRPNDPAAPADAQHARHPRQVGDHLGPGELLLHRAQLAVELRHVGARGHDRRLRGAFVAVGVLVQVRGHQAPAANDLAGRGGSPGRPGCAAAWTSRRRSARRCRSARRRPPRSRAPWNTVHEPNDFSTPTSAASVVTGGARRSVRATTAEARAPATVRSSHRTAGHSWSSIENQAVSRFRPLMIMCWRNTPSNVNAEPLGGRARSGVQRIALPFDPPVTQLVERLAAASGTPTRCSRGSAGLEASTRCSRAPGAASPVHAHERDDADGLAARRVRSP